MVNGQVTINYSVDARDLKTFPLPPLPHLWFQTVHWVKYHVFIQPYSDIHMSSEEGENTQ